MQKLREKRISVGNLPASQSYCFSSSFYLMFRKKIHVFQHLKWQFLKTNERISLKLQMLNSLKDFN